MRISSPKLALAIVAALVLAACHQPTPAEIAKAQADQRAADQAAAAQQAADDAKAKADAQAAAAKQDQAQGPAPDVAALDSFWKPVEDCTNASMRPAIRGLAGVDPASAGVACGDLSAGADDPPPVAELHASLKAATAIGATADTSLAKQAIAVADVANARGESRKPKAAAQTMLFVAHVYEQTKGSVTPHDLKSALYDLGPRADHISDEQLAVLAATLYAQHQHLNARPAP